MPVELLILRHAKSDWQQNCSDFERPLNARGAQDAPRVGRWLRAQKLVPNAILSSPATRARQTAEAVCQTAQIPVERIQWTDGLYLASLERLRAYLLDTPAHTQRLLVIGHNPGLDDLLLYLARPPVPHKANGKLMTTAALARLQLDAGWNDIRRGCAELLHIQYPADLAQPD